MLDANQFTRVKILYSLLQLIVMAGTHTSVTNNPDCVCVRACVRAVCAAISESEEIYTCIAPVSHHPSKPTNTTTIYLPTHPQINPGLVHSAFGNEVAFFLGVLKPIALWFDFGTVASFAPHGE